MTLAKAKYAFAKRKDGELTFNKNDIIKVLEKHKSGWWRGELNGIFGRFPSNYCVEIDPTAGVTPSTSPPSSDILIAHFSVYHNYIPKELALLLSIHQNQNGILVNPQVKHAAIQAKSCLLRVVLGYIERILQINPLQVSSKNLPTLTSGP